MNPSSELSTFAYLPNWHDSPDVSASTPLSEPWCYKTDYYGEHISASLPVLKMCLHQVFRTLIIGHQSARSSMSVLAAIFTRGGGGG